MTIKLRYWHRGGHMHVQVFMGPRGETLVNLGTLVMNQEELRMFATVLEYGSVHQPQIDLEWEEPCA